MKKYKMKYPQFLGLDPDKELIFHETVRGYKSEINKIGWIGLPKILVENTPDVFEQII